MRMTWVPRSQKRYGLNRHVVHAFIRQPCPVPIQTWCLLLEQVGREGSLFSPSFRVRLSSGAGWGSGSLRSLGLLLSGQS